VESGLGAGPPTREGVDMGLSSVFLLILHLFITSISYNLQSTLIRTEHETTAAIPLLVFDASGNQTKVTIQIPCSGTIEPFVLAFCTSNKLGSQACDSLLEAAQRETQRQCDRSLWGGTLEGQIVGESNINGGADGSFMLESDAKQRRSSIPRSSETNHKEANRSQKCIARDQMEYCVYYDSLCIESNGELRVLTDDASVDGKYVNFSNLLSRSPLHVPLLDRLLKSQIDEFIVKGPYRSFFPGAKMSTLPPKGATWIPDWSLVAAFDYATSNIFHFVTKIHVGFLARYYEIEGLGESHSYSNGMGEDYEAQAHTMTDPLSNGALKNTMQGDVISKAEGALKQLLYNRSSGFRSAYLYHRQMTSWQRNYAELALGMETKIFTEDDILREAPMCFRRAIVPGASLGVGDGLTTSMVFREMAATLKGIRVPDEERNVIIIFQHPSSTIRAIINIEDVVQAVRDLADQYKMEVRLESWSVDTPFEYQALLMARTRVMISMHGAVQNNCIFMEAGGVVLEINPYQFIYPLYQWIAMNRGHYYLRHEVGLEDTVYYEHSDGDAGRKNEVDIDPFPGMTAGDCARNTKKCYLVRRDASVRVSLSWFRPLVQQAISLVVHTDILACITSL
jgi:hypothetical protein